MTGTRLHYLTGEFCASFQPLYRYRAAASPACSQLKSLLVCFGIFSEGIVFFLDGSCYKNDLKEFRFTYWLNVMSSTSASCLMRTGKAVAIAAFSNTHEHTRTQKMEYSKFSRFYDSLTQFKCYEDYLDSKVTPLDLFYFKVSEK